MLLTALTQCLGLYGIDMTLHRLVYVSVAARPLSEADLTGLLQQSRAANTRDDITGILLYRDGAFLQVLEGGERVIRETFDRIIADPRHRDIQTVIDETTDARDFPDWSMGFENLNETKVRGLEGYADIFDRGNEAFTFFWDLQRVRQFLMLFSPRVNQAML